RRHTRFSRDWSSDVCSSDLHGVCNTLGKSHGATVFKENQMDYITAYEITASFERDGQVQDASQAEVLVDAFGKIFFEEVAAEAFAEELQEDLDSTDLDPTTEYSVREVSVEVEIDLADADPDGPSDEYSH